MKLDKGQKITPLAGMVIVLIIFALPLFCSASQTNLSKEEKDTFIIVSIITLVAIIVTICIVFLVIKALCCWIFRINEIVELLKQIAHTDERNAVFRHQADFKLCSGCNIKHSANELIKIDSGQWLCPECHKNLKSAFKV